MVLQATRTACVHSSSVRKRVTSRCGVASFFDSHFLQIVWRRVSASGPLRCPSASVYS